MSTPITEDMIQHAEDAGACPEGIAWLRAQPRTLDELREERHDDYLWAIRRLNIPELTNYAIDNNPTATELRYIAGNPFASPDDLLTYARGGPARLAVDISGHVAFNPNAPAEALSIAYARNEHSSAVMRAIAQHPNATPELLHAISLSPAH